MSEPTTIFGEISTSIDNAQYSIQSKVEIDELEKQERKSKLEKDTTDNSLRVNLATWTCVVVSLWLMFVLGFLINQKPLSDNVLITLLTTTTVNILGLSLIVLRGMFKVDS